jgi:hypoxanthine phosphoribosyltransferase
MNTEQKLHITWKTLNDDVLKLAQMLRENNVSPDWIFGITTGGLIPLALLAKQLKTRNVTTVTASSYDENNVRGAVHIKALPDISLAEKNVLLVDEIADSGETLRAIKNELLRLHPRTTITTAVLCVRTDHCTYLPDFSARNVTEWVVFPWDSE